MRCELDMNLLSQLFAAIFARELSMYNSTAANYSLRICDVIIRIAFAGSMNRLSVQHPLGDILKELLKQEV